MPNVSFTEAIHQATKHILETDPKAHVFGLGATYRNGIDNTMGTLGADYPDRVHDTPCSEAAVTGMAVGAALMGLHPIVHHGRVEFAQFACDQILNQAAKWNYSFGGNYPCPLVLRIAIGRQWGNGPQHTQVARAMFAIPGLKVVVPSSPRMAKGLLLAAIEDQNPVVYLEHRWLYKLRGEVEGTKPEPLCKAQVIRHGKDITIVAVADMVLEALRAARRLSEIGVEAEVIDLVSLNPIDYETIARSVANTRRLIIADVSTPEFNIGNQIIGEFEQVGICDNSDYGQLMSLLKRPTVLTCPSAPCPTAPSLSARYYPTDNEIVSETLSQIGLLGQQPKPRTFQELHLPPTENIDDLCAIPSL